MGLVMVSGAAFFPPASALAETSGHGLKLWARTYDGPVHGYDSAVALVVSPDGARVYVTGNSPGPTSTDYLTVAYDLATGVADWVARYNAPAHRDDYATAVAVSPDGSRVFVTGQSVFNFGTVAYDAATGTRLWATQYDGPAHEDDIAQALAVSPDGSRVFVTGASSGRSTLFDYATIAYEAATGATQWVRRHNGPDDSYDMPEALAVSPDGSRVFVSGANIGPGGNSNYGTVAYDAATGTSLWFRGYGGLLAGRSNAIAVDPDGSRVYVSGTIAGHESFDYAVVVYDTATGATRWVSRYNGAGHRDERSTGMVLSPDGSRVFVTGVSTFDYATVAFDADTGAKQWVSRYNAKGGFAAVAQALAVSPDGSRVFVTGASQDTASGYFATLSYDAATGARKGLHRYRGGTPGGGAEPYAMGVSPDGSTVVVTGVTFNLSIPPDYGTVAYRTT